MRGTYDGNLGELTTELGDFGFWAWFCADDWSQEGVTFCTFASGHESAESAIKSAIKSGFNPHDQEEVK